MNNGQNNGQGAPEISEKERADQNNANNVKNAADVAIATKNPYAMAAGYAVKGVDKLTGGKASKAIGKGITKANKMTPGGRTAQKSLNKMSESGASDKIGQAARMKNGGKGGAKNAAAKGGNKAANNVNKPANQQNNTSSSSTSNEKDKGGKIIIHVMVSVLLSILPMVLFFVVVIIVPILVVLLVLHIVTYESINDSSSSSNSIASYYVPTCQYFTVLTKDTGYDILQSKTYDLRDYVAGVVSAEVGGFGDIETYKAFAIAARTYAEAKVGNTNECVIKGDDSAQAFNDISNDSSADAALIYQAVDATYGLYVLDSLGNIYMTEYDAFCLKEKDSSYYTIVQKEQKIPIDWVEAHISSSTPKGYGYKNCKCQTPDPSITACYDDNGKWLDGGHGNGMSQYGALYLSTEMNYTYDQILSYYYDEDIELSNSSYSTISLDIKDTTIDSSALHSSLSGYLEKNGSSITEINNYIYNSVSSAGRGTREGVVTAAVSLINYLYDNYGVRIPYDRDNGKRYELGVDETWGSYDENSDRYKYNGLDCSGFVQWAIINGGFKDPGNGSAINSLNFYNKFKGDSCDKKDSDCVGQIGDLLCTKEKGHIVLIVGVDNDNQQYMIAESNGSDGVITRKISMHSGEYENYAVLHMDEYYANNKS